MTAVLPSVDTMFCAVNCEASKGVYPSAAITWVLFSEEIPRPPAPYDSPPAGSMRNFLSSPAAKSNSMPCAVMVTALT